MVEDIACDHRPNQDEAVKHVVATYKNVWGEEFNEHDVFNVYVAEFEKTGAIGTDKRYLVKLEEITTANCDHSDYIENMDGSGKCRDCGIVKEVVEDAA